MRAKIINMHVILKNIKLTKKKVFGDSIEWHVDIVRNPGSYRMKEKIFYPLKNLVKK